MKLLLDTHVAIWALTESRRIPPRLFEVLADPHNTAAVSAVAVWEIAIKHRLARTDSPPFSAHEAIGHFGRAGFSLLDVTAAHTAFVEHLPPIHSDPFDRLMLAQAMVETLHLVTLDRQLLRYGAPVLTWD